MKTPLILILCLTLINTRKRRKLTKAQMGNEYWNKYFQKVDKLVENFNLSQDKDGLIEHMGEPGTEMDKSYPFYFFQKKYTAKKLMDIDEKTSNIKAIRSENGEVPLPIREECEDFHKDFKDPCEIYRDLRQVKNKIRLNKNVWKSEKKRKYSSNRKNKKNHMLTKKNKNFQKKKKEKRFLIGKKKLDFLRRQLMLPAVPGGGAAQPQAAPQIDDSRIIVHSFAAPPAPQPNLIRAYDGNGQNQLIQARIKIPPRYLKLKEYIPII